MDTYLAIITTVLVISQIIRVIQNATQLRRQKILFEKQLKELADMEVTERDFETQRKAYRLAVEFFERRAEDGT
jgi:hypothetical protein